EQGPRGAVTATAAVPEPSTSLTFACAASLTMLSARRRRL
ncbi:MAG: PEP-CTERM sorting domain-containing protein, partial [Planctomycetales bacterium]|nr:PEP-CTERM sorting domain-containing protein [Planctomycetales bacterium]